MQTHNENLNSLIDPFAIEGYQDFLEGYEMQDCPHDDGTDSEYGWKNGWYKAYLFELELARQTAKRKE